MIEPSEDMDSCERHRYHEAGHVVMMFHYCICIRSAKVNCKQNGTYEGKAEPLDDNDLTKDPFNACKCYCAGYGATQIVCNRGDLSQDDANGAYQMAERLVISSGVL
jgi:hypothetical protein